MSNPQHKHHWEIAHRELYRSFTFPTFSSSIAFVIAVGRIAELQDHHPTIIVEYNQVTLRVVTHDMGNQITERDHKLAAKIDSIYYF